MPTTDRRPTKPSRLVRHATWIMLASTMLALAPPPALEAKTPLHSASTANSATNANPATKQTKPAQPKGQAGPPQTTIKDKPEQSTASDQARFTYGSSDAKATFECALDGAAFAACDSAGRTYAGLTPGKHTFRVRAVGAAGNEDKNPATYSWTITRPKPDATTKRNDAGTGRKKSARPPSGTQNATGSTAPPITLPFKDGFENGDLAN